jgi:hypothetical protein
MILVSGSTGNAGGQSSARRRAAASACARSFDPDRMIVFGLGGLAWAPFAPVAYCRDRAAGDREGGPAYTDGATE